MTLDQSTAILALTTAGIELFSAGIGVGAYLVRLGQRHRLARRLAQSPVEGDRWHESLVFWANESDDSRRRWEEEYDRLAAKNPELAKYLDEVFGARTSAPSGK